MKPPILKILTSIMNNLPEIESAQLTNNHEIYFKATPTTSPNNIDKMILGFKKDARNSFKKEYLLQYTRKDALILPVKGVLTLEPSPEVANKKYVSLSDL